MQELNWKYLSNLTSSTITNEQEAENAYEQVVDFFEEDTYHFLYLKEGESN